MSHGKSFAALAIAIALSGTAFAHGKSPHLMGTAESVSGEHLVVKDTKGASHDVRLGPETRYRTEDGGAAKADDLKAGDRVVVHFGDKGSKGPAAEVRFKAK